MFSVRRKLAKRGPTRKGLSVTYAVWTPASDITSVNIGWYG